MAGSKNKETMDRTMEAPVFADIAEALAPDYDRLYYVDLENEDFLELNPPSDKAEMSTIRQGEKFFDTVLEELLPGIDEKDRDAVRKNFTKENVLHELKKHGSFKLPYRVTDSGIPVYVGMKGMSMRKKDRYLIFGVTPIDAYMKKNEAVNEFWKEMDNYARIMAFSGDYRTIYIIDPNTEHYRKFIVMDDEGNLGLEAEGDNFFDERVREEGKDVAPDDLPLYMRTFKKDQMMSDVQSFGTYTRHYRCMINGESKPVSLKIAMIREESGDKLIAGIRVWRERR